MDRHARPLGQQAEQRPAAPDLDVVGMGAQAQHAQRRPRRGAERQREHAGADRAVSAARSPLMKLSSVHM